MLPSISASAALSSFSWYLLAAQPAVAAGDGPAWSPYLAGGLIGVLSWLTFYISDKPIGASTAYARLAGLVARLFARRHVESLRYYRENKPKVDWEVLLVGGIIVGAFAAAWTGNELTARWIPPAWGERFGESTGLRLLVGFLGGAVMAFGARLADGCTSGHGISGTLQLSVGSWISLICFFLGGVVTARLLFAAG